MKCLSGTLLLVFVMAVTLTSVSCRERDPYPPPVPRTAADAGQTNSPQAPRMEAVANLQPTEGNQVSGTVTFTEMERGVHVVGQLTGLPQAGPFGFHVHEVGDCSAPDATSAGGHYNPHGTPHGSPDAPAQLRHAGDLGNIVAREDGSAQYERIDHVLQLSGPDSIIGRSVLVHAHHDDLVSQPTGEAGARLACGVIESVSP